MKHYYDTIQGWFDYGWIIDRAVSESRDGDVIVEIGGWKGRSAAYAGVAIANSGKNIRYHVVDHWLGNITHNTPGSKTYTPELADPDWLYQEFLKNTAPVDRWVKPIRLPSEKASSWYADASLRMVFIDGEHTTEAVLNDIRHWMAKVAIGGILAGHDWKWQTVQKAVVDSIGASVESKGNVWFTKRTH